METYEKNDIVGFKWSLRQYVSPMGRKAVETWRSARPIGEARAGVDTFLKLMAKQNEWSYPDISPLKGKKYAGLTELRWTAAKVEHRIIGFISGDHVYTMLIGCTHKQRVYDPHDALKTAGDRRSKLRNGEATSCEYPLLTGL